jgi:EmrB/QacA subfamily drug resistance transporter
VSGEYPPGEDPRRWRALVVTLAGGFMILLDVSIVTVAVPSIQHGLGSSASGVQWVVSGYPLTFGLALVAGGRLGDAFGRRRIYLIALSAFVVTSVLAGLAPTLLLLIVARLLQGLVAGLVTPQNGGLIQDLFRGAERGRAFGLLGATIGVSTAAGPVIGGIILDAFGEPNGWRWVFLVNVPFGLLTLVLAVLLVPPIPSRSTSPDIDLVGIVLLGACVLCVLFPVVQFDSGGLRRFWWLLVLAVPLGYAFHRWEHRRVAEDRAPLVDMRLFTSTPGFSPGAAIGTVYFCGFAGIWLVFAVFFQSGLGFSPLQSGLSVTPFALGSAVSAWLAGRLVARWGRRLTIAGLAMVATGLAGVAVVALLVDTAHLVPAIVLPMLLAGVGGGAVISPNTTITLSFVPSGMSGVASGVLQTGQRIGTAVGTAALAAVFYAVAGGSHYPAGLAAALFAAVVLVLIALVLAVVDFRGNLGNNKLENFPEHTMTSSQ